MNRAHRAKDEWLRPTLEGLLSPEEVEAMAAEPAESLWADAVQRGFVTDEELAAAVAVRFRLKVANLDAISPQAVELLPEGLARRYGVIPLSVTDTSIDVASADPLDLDCEQTLAFALGRTVRMAVAPPAAIERKLNEVYRPRDVLRQFVSNMTTSIEVEAIDERTEEEDIDLLATQAGDRPVIQLVDRVIAEAVQARASDIHLEPEETGVAVRYRIDGVLRQMMVLPKAVKVPIVSRVKIMAQLDIADRLRPQDGRARVSVAGNRIDLRISTLPASQGEKVVIRILDQSNTILSLEALGLLEDEYRALTALMDSREGMVLVTGPTGSGKTTTLYSILHTIKDRGVNIITVEDPVEYRLPGIVQVQVNEKAGLTFPSALRSILRQDPDVILLGEIRDKETATIGVQAALTGHLVLSTLHTNDAAASITRLTDIGVEAYKIAAALKGIVAQRLLRRLCALCKEPARPDEVPEKFRHYFPVDVPLFRAVGCPECATTGYRGRHAVHEMLAITDDLQARIAAGESVDQLIEAARAAGMRSLWDSGVEHVKRGDTTITELLRVLEAPPEERARARATQFGTPVRETPSVTLAAPPARSSSPIPETVSAVPPTAPAPTPFPVPPRTTVEYTGDEMPAAIDRDPMPSVTPPPVPMPPAPAAPPMAPRAAPPAPPSPRAPEYPVPASQEFSSVTGHISLDGYAPPITERGSAKVPPPPRRTTRMPPESASLSRPAMRPTTSVAMGPTGTASTAVPRPTTPPAPRPTVAASPVVPPQGPPPVAPPVVPPVGPPVQVPIVSSAPPPQAEVPALPIMSAWDYVRDPVSVSGPSGGRGREPSSGASARQTPRFSGPAPRILLVEDEDPLRRVMKDLLEREGFVIFEAGDGVQALDLVDRLRPEALVLDLNLPRLDGFQVLQHLRSRAATQRLPVIVLTANGDEESEVRAFKEGATDFLTKPFRARALSTRLLTVLGRTVISGH